jgi:hypothetical protein
MMPNRVDMTPSRFHLEQSGRPAWLSVPISVAAFAVVLQGFQFLFWKGAELVRLLGVLLCLVGFAVHLRWGSRPNRRDRSIRRLKA